MNLVRQAQGTPSITADVLPHVEVDLASYSAWDTKGSPAQFAEALVFLATHKRPTEPFGEHGVHVGEFGLPGSEGTPQVVLDRTTASLAEAQRFGRPYAIYRQLYCNEPSERGLQRLLAGALRWDAEPGLPAVSMNPKSKSSGSAASEAHGR